MELRAPRMLNVKRPLGVASIFSVKVSRCAAPTEFQAALDERSLRYSLSASEACEAAFLGVTAFEPRKNSREKL
jgi:hypothetical protein